MTCAPRRLPNAVPSAPASPVPPQSGRAEEAAPLPRWPTPLHRAWRAFLLAIGPAGWLALAVVLLWLMRWI